MALKMSLKLLKTNADRLASRNDSQDKQVRFHRTRAETFVAVDLLLQSLLIMGVSIRSSSPSLKPMEWLVPFAAILLSSVTFFIAFLEAAFSFYMTQFELDKNYIDLHCLHRAIDEAERSRDRSSLSYLTLKVHPVQIDQESSNSSDEEHDPEVVISTIHEDSRPDPVQLFMRKSFIYSTALALAGFTAVELYACRLLLQR